MPLMLFYGKISLYFSRSLWTGVKASISYFTINFWGPFYCFIYELQFLLQFYLSDMQYFFNREISLILISYLSLTFHFIVALKIRLINYENIFSTNHSFIIDTFNLTIWASTKIFNVEFMWDFITEQLMRIYFNYDELQSFRL